MFGKENQIGPSLRKIKKELIWSYLFKNLLNYFENLFWLKQGCFDTTMTITFILTLTRVNYDWPSMPVWSVRCSNLASN
jgi:hypothetical protein